MAADRGTRCGARLAGAGRVLSTGLLLGVVLAVGAPAASGEEQPMWRSALELRLYPEGEALEVPVDLLLTDPTGRRVGRTAAGSELLLEIPGSSYERESLDDDESGAPGPSTLVVWVPDPPCGDLLLELSAHDPGALTLTARLLYPGEAGSRAELVGVQVRRGDLQRFHVLSPCAPEGSLELRRAPPVGADSSGRTP